MIALIQLSAVVLPLVCIQVSAYLARNSTATSATITLNACLDVAMLASVVTSCSVMRHVQLTRIAK